jgi:hypothetical protein
MLLSKQSLMTPASGPTDILFADKAAIQKILVDEDFRKSRDYERAREDPHVTSLITETDKVKYKQKVITILLRIYDRRTYFESETTAIPRFLNQLLEWLGTAHA